MYPLWGRLNKAVGTSGIGKILGGRWLVVLPRRRSPSIGCGRCRGEKREEKEKEKEDEEAASPEEEWLARAFEEVPGDTSDVVFHCLDDFSAPSQTASDCHVW